MHGSRCHYSSFSCKLTIAASAAATTVDASTNKYTYRFSSFSSNNFSTRRNKNR
ncbi:conserved hypothetical protein [Ricinus communis]|uniref:Uncharacterized protein n=1 Tax=Ricinus communis TaxID=3988 RepID=B9RAJ7_RICCO|nr:conserved hypothetical protein [Ricinus communis]